MIWTRCSFMRPCQEAQLGAVLRRLRNRLDPALDLGIDLPGQAATVASFRQIRVRRSALLRRLRYSQSLICLPFAFFALALMAGEKPVQIASAALGQTAPEGVAEKIEAGVPEVPPAVRVLAVRDLRLPGMQLKTQGLKPRGDGSPQPAGLVLAVAVSDNVIPRSAQTGTATGIPGPSTCRTRSA